MSAVLIEALGAETVRQQDAASLCALLVDAVAHGASVGWVRPPSLEAASQYWHLVADQVEAGTAVLLVARLAGRLVGTVQLQLSARENGRHRGEVARLLVHTEARRRGIGTALMRAVEEAAKHRGLHILVLDTRTGDPSQVLYETLGYQLVGVIPDYAHGTSGALEPTSIMYKLLEHPDGQTV